MENSAFIAEICARLDGLPLALELAAARTRTLPPRVLLQRLQSATEAPSLRLLAGGPRDAPSRQQTLRETIAWSYSLLTEPDQLASGAWPVFVGGCTAGAAESVCALRRKTVTLKVRLAPPRLSTSWMLIMA